jgi:hypothetical protein
MTSPFDIILSENTTQKSGGEQKARIAGINRSNGK